MDFEGRTSTEIRRALTLTHNKLDTRSVPSTAAGRRKPRGPPSVLIAKDTAAGRPSS